MVLSDKDIRQVLCAGDLVIDPLDDNRVQPASIDLTLDDEFLVPSIVRSWERLHHKIVLKPSSPIIDLNDVKESVDAEPMLPRKDPALLLMPQEFCLGSTVERVEIPNYLVGRIEGKSSLGRLGLMIHATAGYIDPGWKGKITLEIYNLNYRPIILRSGKGICQLSFAYLASPAAYPYGHEKIGSRYQNQTTVTASRYED